MELNKALSDLFKKRKKQVFFNSVDHSYTSGGERYTSVTTLLSKFKKPFDADYWAKNCVLNRRLKSLTEAQTKELDTIIGVPKKIEFVKWCWVQKGIEKANYGTKTHAYAESIFVEGGGVKNNALPEHKSVNTIYDRLYKKRFRLVGSEIMLHDDTLKIAGTADLLVEKDGKILMLDWKVVEGFKKGYNKMYTPFNEFYDHQFNVYKFQQAIYAYLIKKITGLNVQAFLVQIHGEMINTIGVDCGCMDFIENNINTIMRHFELSKTKK